MFTTEKWNVAQTVSVTVVNELIVDGNIAYSIVTAPATSADPVYNNLNASDVSVTNTDNDVAGINVSPASGLKTAGAGGSGELAGGRIIQTKTRGTVGVTRTDPTQGAGGPTVGRV